MCVRILYLQQPPGYLHPLFSARATRPTAYAECNLEATRNYLKKESCTELLSGKRLASANHLAEPALALSN